MPKFLTYQRPAPIKKGNWNTAPDRKAPLPLKAPDATRPATQPALPPPLDQLLGKS
jgi:hypothetical protein